MKTKKLHNWKKEDLVKELERKNYQYGEICNKYAKIKHKVWEDLFNLKNLVNLSVYKRPISEDLNEFVLWIRKEIDLVVKKYKSNNQDDNPFTKRCSCMWTEDDEYGFMPNTECEVHGKKTRKMLKGAVPYEK